MIVQNLWRIVRTAATVAGAAASLILVGVPAQPASALELVVTSGEDAVDAAPGDGECATAQGECTLRAAVQEANATAGLDRVVLPAGVFSLSLLGEEDESLAGDLDITEEIVLQGDGRESSVVDCGGLTAFMEVMPGVNAQLSDFTVRGCVYENHLITLLNRGPEMQLLDVGFEGNGIEDSFGTVLHNDGGLHLSRVHFVDNFGTSIENEGRALMEDLTMIGNAGAIDSQDGSLRVIRADISGNGGGIFGCPTIIDSVLRDNQAWGVACPGSGVVVVRSVVSGNGGVGVLSDGSVRIVESTIENNGANPSTVADVSGLGFVSTGGVGALGKAWIENSAIIGNQGTGVDAGSGATLRNVTVSGNGGPFSLGGVQLNRAPNRIEDSSIVGNMGAGIHLGDGSSVDVRRSIIFANFDPDGVEEDCGTALGLALGTLRSEGNNLLSSATDRCVVTLLDTDLVDIDPMLGPLADNGGATVTHAPLDGSPAIDAGGGDCHAFDQRGVGRPQGEQCDIGAVESQASCGDGALDPGEACDDGNTIDDDCCTSLCRFAVAKPGDCNGDGVVRIEDLTLAVRLALVADLSLRCAAVDTDSDLRVSIAELIAAVREALAGEVQTCG